jgi:O-antigen/teichoic acid export membrane protein
MIDIKKIKSKINKLKETGFFSIFIATILSKVITVLGGIILVRILSKNDYGIYEYVLNCYSMLFLLNDFGISFATLQYLTENIKNEDEKRRILHFSFKSSIIVSAVTSLLIITSPLFYPYKIAEAKLLTQILFLVPSFTTIINILSVVLRANFENKKYGILQIFTTFITYFMLIVFSIMFGLKGVVISQYAYQFIILLFSIFLCYKYIKCLMKKDKTSKKMSKENKKGFLKYAFAGQLNSSIGGLLLIEDTFLIGYIIATPEKIATYNVGSKIPYALTFIASCVSVYITPYFIIHKDDFDWIKKNLNQLIKYSCIGFGIICFLLIAFSKIIFTILFGNQYYDAIPIYIILTIGLFFNSVIKVPCSNILGALRKLNVNIITNIACVIFNFISNIIFIKWLGIIGAAITTTVTNIIISIVYLIYLKKYIKERRKIIDTG